MEEKQTKNVADPEAVNVHLLDEGVVVVTLSREAKRNALDERMISQLDEAFSSFGSDVRAIVLAAAGTHFCAGLDLFEHVQLQRTPEQFLRICRKWHEVFDRIQHGGVPVIAALHGAVVGGGLELASAAHIRVGDSTAYFALPEGQRGIFTGGGATVRTARLVTPHRMIDMMLTGRVLGAAEAESIGLLNYVTAQGDAINKACELARKIASNARLSNFAIVSSINRIADMSSSDGLFTEALMAAVVQSGSEVQERLSSFRDSTFSRVTQSEKQGRHS